MINPGRRELIKFSAVLGALPILSACGGGADALAAPETSGKTSTPAPIPGSAPISGLAPVLPVVTGAYRSGQSYLFQNIATPTYRSTLGGGAYNADTWGPTYTYVDFYSGWPWGNPGGDWTDANGTQQGTVAWASFPANSASGSMAVFSYTGIDVTVLLAHCQANNKPAAFIVRGNGTGARHVASLFSTLGPVPQINVTYTDASSAVLACRILSANTNSSTVPTCTGDRIGVSFFIEFDRPTKAVQSATTNLTVTSHWSGSTTLQYFLCSPIPNSEPVTGTDGLARLSGGKDESISSISGVIGAQRYVDGSALTDFVVPGSGNHTSENAYDPSLWGGAQDLTKYPHNCVGKWVNPPTGTLSLVPSSYNGEGFTPLTPGLGALKMVMPDGGIQTGQEGGSYGGAGCNMKLFMPYADMGLLRTIFVRYYLRLGAPQIRTPADRREVLKAGIPWWSDMAGKMGISASHVTSYGGTSASSGGGYGWQMRHAWAECEAGVGGPTEGGLIPGWHLYDFQSSNPPAYRYGGEGQYANNWGQKGGLGAVIYAGRWYCVECEITLNSVNAVDNSYTPDGALRTWIDGRLTYERTGMVFRSLPIYQPAFNGTFIRPMRELGIKELWWNWYNGGTTQSTVTRTQFVTGLVWARSRIGPMK